MRPGGADLRTAGVDLRDLVGCWLILSQRELIRGLKGLICDLSVLIKSLKSLIRGIDGLWRPELRPDLRPGFELWRPSKHYLRL